MKMQRRKKSKEGSIQKIDLLKRKIVLSWIRISMLTEEYLI